MFENKKIESKQFYNGKELYFDPDSSPEAWEHYKKIYSNKNKLLFYNLEYPSFYKYLDSPIEKNGKKYRYSSKPKNKKSERLFALHENTNKYKRRDGSYLYEPCLRLAGDVDFNYGDKNKISHYKCKTRYKFYKSILETEQNEDIKSNYLDKLIECKSYHHTLVNFSLMQSIGNMQGLKGKKDDRLDTFIQYLNDFYDSKDKTNTEIAQCATNQNRESLINFLCEFDDVYDYCKTFYFVEDRDFVKRLIENGKHSISDVEVLKNYIDLSLEYWDMKEKHFKES